PLPLLGRLLGDQVGASPRSACGARGRFGRLRTDPVEARTAAAEDRPARPADPGLCPHGSRYGSCMSATPYQRSRPVETVGGFLAAASIFVSLTGIAYRPLRLIPFAIILGLIAVGIGGRCERIGTWAVSI